VGVLAATEQSAIQKEVLVHQVLGDLRVFLVCSLLVMLG
jgi:hypothetical protein